MKHKRIKPYNGKQSRLEEISRLRSAIHKASKWLHNADLEDPKASDEAMDLANELETTVNESKQKGKRKC